MTTFLRLHDVSSRFDTALQEFGGSAFALVLRVFIAWQFFKSGLVKVADWGSTVALFRDEYHVPLVPPELAAAMGAAGELVLPVLLVVGLFSRPAALGLFAVNLIAVISYPQLFTFECPAALNDHFYWGALLLVLVAWGPGKVSMDAWLHRRAVL
ncbi:DoxX family protein [Actimicrobium antarcticum]|uniref:DoxX family protein n=1 Tax=Actimicrobium antarcticum TaxID=1051899 RepID=A0ABP7TGH1_9BURK